MAGKDVPYRVDVTRGEEGFHVGIIRKDVGTVIDVTLNYELLEGRWHMWLKYFIGAENEKFFKKYGRNSSEELSIHLANLVKTFDSPINYIGDFPKGFMHPRCADMEPVLKSPKDLMKIKEPPPFYTKPRLKRISRKEAAFKKWLHGKRPR